MSEAIDVDVIEHPALTTPATRPRDALAEFGIEDLGMARAQRLANQIAGLIDEKGLSVQIGRGNHIRVEGWCALGSLTGVTPQTDGRPEAIVDEAGRFLGYEAACVAVRVETGQIIGRAVAACFADEQEKRRDDGSWYDRWMVNGRANRHAILSMAQTRATSKALGQVLRFIPVMAGYSGTPFEEMAVIDGEPAAQPQRAAPAPQNRPQATRPQAPAPRPTPQQAAPQAGTGREISEKQNKRLWAIAYGRVKQGGAGGWDADMIVRSVIAPREHSTEVQWGDDYEAVCAQIEAWTPPAQDGGSEPGYEPGDPREYDDTIAPDGEPF